MYRVLFKPIKYNFYKQYYLLAEKHYTSLHICIEIHHLITDTEIFCFCFSITDERIVGFKLSFCNQNKVNYSDVLNILLMSVEQTFKIFCLFVQLISNWPSSHWLPLFFFFIKSPGFGGFLSGKEYSQQCRSHRKPRLNPWVRKIPWRRAQQPTSILLSENPHGQRSLVGYSPLGHKEFDKPEANLACMQTLGFLKKTGQNRYISKAQRKKANSANKYFCFLWPEC